MSVIPLLKTLCLNEIRTRHFEPLEKEMGAEELGLAIGYNTSLDDLIEVALERDSAALIEVVLTHPDLDFEALYKRTFAWKHRRVLRALIASPKVLSLSNDSLNGVLWFAARQGYERVVMAIFWTQTEPKILQMRSSIMQQHN